MTAQERLVATTSLVTVRLADLADVLGVTSQVLSQWRSGKRTPHPDNLRVLASWYLKHGEKMMEAAADLRELAYLLEDPDRREELVVVRPRPDSAATKRQRKPKKTVPPQLLRRHGCLPAVWKAVRWFVKSRA